MKKKGENDAGNECCGRNLDVPWRCGVVSSRSGWCRESRVILKLRVFRGRRAVLGWQILNSHEAWEVCAEYRDSQELLEVFELTQCRRHWRDGINLLMWRRCLYFLNGEKLHQFLTDSVLGVCLCMHAWMPNLWRLFDLEGCGIRGTARTELYATTQAAYQCLPFAAQLSEISKHRLLSVHFTCMVWWL